MRGNETVVAMRILTVLGLIFLAASCGPSLDPAQSTLSPETQQWSGQVIRELNHYRSQQGLEPLQEHPGLQILCMEHSDWLRKKRGSSLLHGSNVSHSGSHYRARVARIQFGMEAWGENVAYISNTPEDLARHLIVMWKGSAPHNKAMLGNWTHAGVAISVDEDGAIFATMNFGRLSAAPSSN